MARLSQGLQSGDWQNAALGFGSWNISAFQFSDLVPEPKGPARLQTGPSQLVHADPQGRLTGGARQRQADAKDAAWKFG